MANARVALEAIMIELGPRAIETVNGMFQGADAALATDLLITKCGSNVPFCEDSTPTEMDRIRLAALKVSGGSYTELQKAVEFACTDWRDLLIAAGFGHDPEALIKWEP